MAFKVNQWVHDPLNGIGKVKSFEEMALSGKVYKFMLLTFEKPTFLARVPLETIHQRGIRPLATKQEIKRALATLKKPKKKYKMLWNQKTNLHEKKLLSGNLLEIAEIVRDLHVPKTSIDIDQSYTEHTLYQKALTRFTQELALVQNIENERAHDHLEQLLQTA